jgi:four helix bundle protein
LIHWRIDAVSVLAATGEQFALRAFVSAADDLQARADAFADQSIKFVEGFPTVHRIQRIAHQFQDAATSVGANYRAARRAKSHADFTAKVGIVSEEADESVYWLTRMKNAISAVRRSISRLCWRKPTNWLVSLAQHIARQNVATAAKINDSMIQSMSQ